MTPAERFVVDTLRERGGEAPARDIVRLAVDAGAGSAATIQRAGSAVAQKVRRGSISIWTLLPEFAPLPKPKRLEPADSRTGDEDLGARLGGYWRWDDRRLRAECARRRLDVDDREWTGVELALLLDAHDAGELQPPAPRTRQPLPY